MVLVARGVDSGTGINVLADAGATGDMQVVKLGISTLGNEGLIPATIADGMLVQVSNASLPTAITSVIPGTGATNLGKAEDAVAASGDTGVAALFVRADTAAASGANGDYVWPIVDALGKLWIASTQTEDAVASSGDRGEFVLAVRRDTPTSGAAAGDYHELEVDALGRLWVTGTQAEDAAATSGDTGHFVLAVRRDTPTSGAAAGDYHELEVDALGRLWVTGTQVEDGAHTSGDAGVQALAVRQDTVGTGIGANGDYVFLQTDSVGRLRTVGKFEDLDATNATSTALEATRVIKASAGKLRGFQGYCAAAGFVQVGNKTTALNGTSDNLAIIIPVESGKPFSWAGTEGGRAFSTGISAGFSSTGATFTSGGSNMWIDAQYD